MLMYSKRGINGLSLLLTIVVFMILIFMKSTFFPQFSFSPTTELGKRSDYVKVQLEINPIEEETPEENSIGSKPIESDKTPLLSTKENVLSNWYLEIPSISLTAEIREGTTKEIMDFYIGHFDETNLTYGNIGLAAHNRGYPVNYFANLKNVKIDDIIKYHYQDFHCTYRVISQKIIPDTDWTNLQTTEENTITLITCVENEPEYRRCVQAVEQK